MTRLLFFLALATLGTAQAAPLGRLFFSPDERARIDQGIDTGPTAAEPSAPASINGVVRRADGRATVWIGGRAEQRTVRRLGDVITEMSRDPGSAPETGATGDTPQVPRIDIRIHRP